MFYYFGAKHRDAGRYQRPVHRLIVEPFAGAAGYSMHHLVRGNADEVILVEKDPRIAELWRRLLAMTPAEVLALPMPKAGERTTDFLWMAAAASNAMGKASGFTLSERAAKSAKGMLRRIAKTLPRVAGKVTILEGDYTDAPDVPATWFIDPPYQSVDGKGRGRGNGYAAGCDAKALDFEALGLWCRSRSGQVIVCEYEGADWLPFVPLLSGMNSVGGSHHEVVWNGQVDTDRLFDPFTDKVSHA